MSKSESVESPRGHFAAQRFGINRLTRPSGRNACCFFHAKEARALSEEQKLTYLEMRIRAREQIKLGRVPCLVPPDLSAGYGSSLNDCVLCGMTIVAAQVEYEVCVAERRLNFHVACYAAWRVECLHRLGDRALRGPAVSGFARRRSMSL
jgi:hypothetical protein